MRRGQAGELKRKAKFRQTMVDSRTAMMNRLETEIDPEMKALLNRIARDPGFTPMPEPESTKQNANVGRRKKAA